MKEGWSYKKLGEVARVQNGFAFDSKLFNDNAIGTPLIRIRDIKRAYSTTYTTESCSSDYFIEDGHVLIGMDGDFNICVWAGGHAYLNQRVCHVVPTDVISPRFIYYFLPFPLKKINDKTSFSTVKHLSSKQVNEILIPVPPLSEQRSIVTRLDAAFSHIDALKANAEKQLNEARKLFQAELAECMKPKEGWEEKKLGEVCIKASNIRWDDVKDDKSYSYIDLTSVDRNLLEITTPQIITKSDTPSRAKQIVLEGDVLFATTRPTLRRLCLIKKRYNNQICSTGYCVLRPKSGVDSKWIFYLLQDKRFYDYIEPLQTGASYPAVTDGLVKDYYIHIPPLIDQQIIVAHLDSLSSNIRKLEELQQKTLAECDALKQAMLREVFE